MSESDRRKAPRFPVALPVTFLDTKTSTPLSTVDVSRGGVFVQSDEPRPLRQLVRLRIDIPAQGEVIEVHGMVVHTRGAADEASDGQPAGIGIEFFGFGGQPRQMWEDLLRGLQAGQPIGGVGGNEAGAPIDGEFEVSTVDPVGSNFAGGLDAPATTPDASAAAAPPPAQEPAAAGRAKLVCRVFPVPLQNAEQLYELYERELVTGSMFVCTPVKIPVGDRVVLRIQHPNSGEAFDFHGLVQTQHADPTYPGLTLALRPSTLARRERFKAFVDRGIPVANNDFDFDFDD